MYDINKSLRIGIDVGGTFTHAVAIDLNTLTLIGKVKVLTTHSAKEGVALGIVGSLQKLIKENNINPEDISLIAHSTTQATNALLEGDVAPVGIIGMGAGMNAWFAKKGTKVDNIKLSEGKILKTFYKFINTTNGLDEEIVKNAIEDLKRKGAQVIVASEAFSVDSEENEKKVVEIAHKIGIPVTSGSEISKLYGLKARTTTAVINASMMPKMIETANMTEKAVRESRINAPLMIMRSDGGVMDINEMRKRPILTMLSGPAAGVAAAMMYIRISDGIFLEVGGTSTDISAVKNGKSQIKSAELGGHSLYFRTLDVRTVGVAGGSMVRIRNDKVTGLGPRSAHIAGLKYSAFSEDDLKSAKLVFISPKSGDPSNYVALNSRGTISHTITTTCAANLLGCVPENDCAYGNQEHIKTAFELLVNNLYPSPIPLPQGAGKNMKGNSEDTAEQILNKAANICKSVVDRLITENKLNPQLITLVGGGGGAAAIVPYLAKKMGMKYSLAPDSDVISAIGVGLAMMRDMIERTIINPSNEDILRIRKEAEQSLASMGAAIDTIEVQIEIEPQKNIVRAMATGTTEIRTKKLDKQKVDYEECKKTAALSLNEKNENISELCSTDGFIVFGVKRKKIKFWGLTDSSWALRAVDKEGIIRLQTNNGVVQLTKVNECIDKLGEIVENYAQYGDGGKTIPDMFVLYGHKILDLTGLMNTEQLISVTRAEIEGLNSQEKIIILGQFH